MLQIGLKVWSTNYAEYVCDILRGFSEGLYQYIELYIVPGSENFASWKNCEIPFVVHAPHSLHGFNLAKSNLRKSNEKMLETAYYAADILKSDTVIIHPGIGGEVKESISQIRECYDARLVVENKPFITIDRKYECVGATFFDLRMLIDQAKVGFCLDFGHAICSANSQKLEPFGLIELLLTLRPALFHLSDGDYNGVIDSHLNYGKGDYPVRRLLGMIPDDARVSVETEKMARVEDFFCDIEILRSYE